MVNAFQQGISFQRGLIRDRQQETLTDYKIEDTKRQDAARKKLVEEFGPKAGDPASWSAVGQETRGAEKFAVERAERAALNTALAIQAYLKNNPDADPSVVIDDFEPMLKKFGLEGEDLATFKTNVVNNPEGTLGGLIAALSPRSAKNRTPAAIQEYQFLQSLSPRERQLYLLNKRAPMQKVTDINGVPTYVADTGYGLYDANSGQMYDYNNQPIDMNQTPVGAGAQPAGGQPAPAGGGQPPAAAGPAPQGAQPAPQGAQPAPAPAQGGGGGTQVQRPLSTVESEAAGQGQIAAEVERQKALGKEQGVTQGEDLPASVSEVKGAQTALRERGTRLDETIQDIDVAMEDVGWGTTGFVGGVSRNIWGTPAYNLDKRLNTIRAKIGFGELQRMRDASPTGGALGQVTEREIEFLQSTLSNIENAQSEEQFVEEMNKLRQRLSTQKQRLAQAFYDTYGVWPDQEISTEVLREANKARLEGGGGGGRQTRQPRATKRYNPETGKLEPI